MSDCIHCKALTEEVNFLRGLTGRLLDLANKPLSQTPRPQGFADIDQREFFGTSPDDETFGVDLYGQKVLIKKEPS